MTQSLKRSAADHTYSNKRITEHKIPQVLRTHSPDGHFITEDSNHFGCKNKKGRSNNHSNEYATFDCMTSDGPDQISSLRSIEHAHQSDKAGGNGNCWHEKNVIYTDTDLVSRYSLAGKHDKNSVKRPATQRHNNHGERGGQTNLENLGEDCSRKGKIL